MTIRETELEDRLRKFLMPRVEASKLSIEGLRRTSYGFSRENWPFDATWTRADGSTGHGEFLLRRDPVGGVLSTDRVIEVAVIDALSNVLEVPSPEVFWVDLEGEHFGRPSLVMKRTHGVCDPFVLTGGVLQLRPERRLALARRFMELVYLIHRIDWRAAGLHEVVRVPEPNTREAANQALDHWEGELRREAVEALPELEFVLVWLRLRAPVSHDIVLVHGDFKPGNTLLDGEDVAAVLDWETAHLGDPLEDIGWVTNPMRASEHQIPGQWERAEMVAHYGRLSGRQICDDEVTWWNVFSNFKLAVISLTGVRSFIDGKMDRVMAPRVYAVNVMLDQIRGAEKVDVNKTNHK